MSGPFKRRASLKTLPAIAISNAGDLRRRRSSVGVTHSSTTSAGQQEVPWDILDRCFLPVVFCQAAAIIISTVLNTLHISQVTSLTLFIWFTISTIAAVLFYHNLKVTAAGKAVLITGCDSRVGYALARQLDELGFTVFAGFQCASDKTAEELKEESSGRLHVLQLDVANETHILAASLYAVEHLPDGAPGLWAVVHCAQWVALGEIEWIPHQVIKKSTNINLLGATRVNQVMLPLVRRAHGRIVFMTSGLCRVASAVRGVHCALLAAVEAQASCLRQELRTRGVDVVVVAPGEFTSGSTWLTDEDMREQAIEMWSQLSQEQRSTYGEDYFETAVRSLEKFTKAQDADMSSVLRALSDSVVRTFPLPKYTPVTRQEKIQAFVADHLPRSVYDIVYSEK
ncbi:PREDICTED: D-beta-hydroxybutyrate dehydrogenase, mitochondrial [Nicrophorus vespilloides]|uniref:D-beta-hydroxybutyrate dehydrogenase, mitochondrial n=1 Tax=Nicrophorus vespilloides TaxID=110193 RepID=A0ABM1M323_NICVS|nr:PREDICTED: D-beta-hydroxybutyrate dehydrogenase, mitochondrial [Nicrophorus vespilloides]